MERALEPAASLAWVADADGRRVFLGSVWLELTGRTATDALGDAWLESMAPGDRPLYLERAAIARAARAGFTATYRLKDAGGEYRAVCDRAEAWFGEDGAFRGHVGTTVPVPPADLSGASVGAEQFRALMARSPDMVYRRRMYPSRRLEYLYGAVTAITGCTADELSADPERVRRSIHPDDWSIVDRANRPESLQHTIVLRWIHPDGRVVWAEHRRVPVFAPDGTLIAIDGIARDVTETIATLDELRESKAQMRQLAARIEAAREEERAAVAREIHDELGQTLTALKLEIMRAVPLVREPGAVDRLQSMIGLAEWAIRTVQRIATTLRPATLDHLGLPEAIASEADAFHARTGVRCRVAMETDATGLTPEQQTTVFRVFQEALTNVARHANASAVSVRIREDGSAFELVIRDNGRGIAPQHVHGPRSIGLLGMRERADRIGGSFEITGGPRRGTTVTIRVPKQPSTTQEPGI